MNVMKLMKQAAAMQERMQKIQAELATREFTFTAGGGTVTAVASGDMTLKRLTIAREAVDPDDVDLLQDLVVAAVNGAFQAAREAAAAEMAKVTGGLNLPGL